MLKKYFSNADIISAAALFLLAAIFAYKNYFIQDDAYIAFVYAKNFAAGNGLVWYPESTEYGYTSFLYTLIVGIFMITGIDPEYISAAINFTAYIITLALTFKLTAGLRNSRLAGYCAEVALATHHTFSAYASGGLETMFLTALITGFYYTLLTNQKTQITKPYLIAALAAAALLTRLDSAILLFPGYVWLLIQTRPATITGIIKNKSLWIAAAIPTACVFALLAWAHSYYGYALPNTFYAKMPSEQSMVPLGIGYITKYLELHSYIPAILLALSAASLASPGRGRILTIFSVIFLWLAYVIYIGGDFMEFRLFVPVLPLFAAIIFSASAKNSGQIHKIIIAAVLFMCVLGNYLHAERFHTKPGVMDFMKDPKTGQYEKIVEPIDGNYDWVNVPNTNWRIIGKAFHELFYTGAPQDVKIATINPGAIAFYSGLPIIDTTGLNTRYVHSNSKAFVFRPGHMIIAEDYVYDNLGTNISLATPQTFCEKNGKLIRTYNHVGAFVSPRRKKMVFIPINDNCFVAGDYRLAHPRIDELISKGIILDYQENKSRIYCPKWLCY